LAQARRTFVDHPTKPKLIASGSAVVMALAAVSIFLATHSLPQALLANVREPQRNLASSFGSLSYPDERTNIAAVLSTFQAPQSLLGINAVTSQIQARMQASANGVPTWDGQGPLPGAAGMPGGFTPSLDMSTSSCSIVPMTFNDVYAPSIELPTLWCGAVSNLTVPAQAAPSIAPSDSSVANSDQPRAILFNPAR
jgi:hypothetical protein